MNNYGFLRLILPFFVSLGASLPASAQLIDGSTLLPVAAQVLIDQVKAGSVLILGENHGIADHRDQHMVILEGLRARGLQVSVGMEFVNYPDQTFLDQYLSGDLNEEQFLNIIDWKGFPFEFYKQQILFPNFSLGERTIGLNIPRFVTSKIAKTGLDSLNPMERNLLPPNFEIGRPSYKDRFAGIMHVPAGPVLDRYFAAQSVWDDTMAFTATQFLATNPNQVLVIVVGEFHAQFGGGLADRIRARKPATNIITLSQLWAVNFQEDGTVIGMTPEEIDREIQPSKVEGPRGDFIWVSKP